MSTTFLVVGATGNTGRAVVQTLSQLLKSNTIFPNYRILALTRTRSSPVAQDLAALPNVEVEEKLWVSITPDWLRERNVVRAFIASHNEPTQFADESTFNLAALNAGVEYVVRISTTAANVRPDCPAYYPRSHWAIEALLGTAEFERMKWTSLQPNVFSHMYLGTAAEFINHFRKTGEQGTLRLMASEDAPVGIVDSDEVGIFAAHLLASDDVARHHKAKYVLNGPVDITGRQIVTLVEEHIGAKVRDVSFKDMSFIDAFVDSFAQKASGSKDLFLSVKDGMAATWAGKCSASTTSKEVIELAAPRITPAEALKSLIA